MLCCGCLSTQPYSPAHLLDKVPPVPSDIPDAFLFTFACSSTNCWQHAGSWCHLASSAGHPVVQQAGRRRKLRCPGACMNGQTGPGDETLQACSKYQALDQQPMAARVMHKGALFGGRYKV